jgi:hypothetical protein
MTKRTRLFVSVAAGILAVGLAAGLLASFLGVQNLGVFEPDGPAELAYASADARLIAYANVRSVMDSELRKRLTASAPLTDRGADRFRDATGIDIRQDIDHVVALSDGGSGSGPPLVLARGRFDQARVERFVTDQGGQVENYQNVKLLVRASLAVAFVEPALIAIGTPASVRQAIDTRDSGTSVTGDDELIELVREVADGDAWAVVKTEGLGGGPVPEEVLKQLPLLSWVSVKGWINGGLRGEIRVDTRDEAAARNLQDVVRGLLALARLQAGQLPPGLMDSLQLTADGTTVTLSFSLPNELIDAIGALGTGREP